MRAILTYLTLFSIIGIFSNCSSVPYKYVPADTAKAAGEARDVAIYSVPQEDPKGKVRVLSLGIVDIEPKKGSDKIRVLHIRMAISNYQGKTVWHMNTQEQFLALPNFKPIPPAVVNSDKNGLPDLEIQPGELRTVDLFFQLPPSLLEEEELGAFDFHWQFEADGERIFNSTAFNRVPIPVAPAVIYPYQPYPYGYGLGWGTVWWGSGIYW